MCRLVMAFFVRQHRQNEKISLLSDGLNPMSAAEDQKAVFQRLWPSIAAAEPFLQNFHEPDVTLPTISISLIDIIVMQVDCQRPALPRVWNPYFE